MKYVDVLHAVTWYVCGEVVTCYFVSTVECSSEQGARRKAERSLSAFFRMRGRKVVSMALGYVRPCGEFDGLAGKTPGFSLCGTNEPV